MKLTDIIPSNKPGTYAGVRFCNRTVERLERFVDENKIPNANTNWHVTLLYSRKHLPNFVPIEHYQQPMIAYASNVNLWPNKDGEKRVLVLEIHCPELYQRHHQLMMKHGATYDFDVYKPHATLSYNAEGVNVDELPVFDKPLKIIGEYQETLKTD